MHDDRDAEGGAADGKPTTQRQVHSPRTAPDARYRILVVDDSAVMAKLFAMMLELMGHETCFASDGEIALDLLDSFRPEIIFSDLSMEKMDGIEFAARVRANEQHRDVILVVHSGYGDARNRDRAAAAGFDFYLVKPAEPRNLTPLFIEIAARKTSR